MNDESGCPSDYSELFLTYFPMLRTIVFRNGIAIEDVEDVAMAILADFMEKDGISWYDAEKLHDVGENPDIPGDRYRTAKFKGMLRSYATKRAWNYRDKQMTRHKKEPWRLEKPLTDDGDSSWSESERYGVDSLDATEAQVVIRAAFQKTREILVSRSTSKRDYGKFIDLALQYGFLDNALDRRAMQEALHISASTLTQMINDLRNTMRPFVEGLLPVAVPNPEPPSPLCAASA